LLLPRLLLLLCLAVGLLAIAYAAAAHAREALGAASRAEERALRAELRERARRLAAELDAELRAAPPAATYDALGRLLRPAPPADARPFPAPVPWPASATIDAALADGGTGAARAVALVRKGVAEGDAALLDEALKDPALDGTDLSYLVRYEAFRLRDAHPDDLWVDDVSALLDGPSDRLGRMLLAAAGATPRVPRAERARLAALDPRPGVFQGDGAICRVTEEGGGFVLRRVDAEGLGRGPVPEPLPDPFGAIAVRGEVDALAVRARLAADRRRLYALYGLAALILVVGTAYAYVAIGRAARLARAKSDFVANITHELKTPLANIRLYGETIRDGRAGGEASEFVRTILDEAARLDVLVEGLLHVARGPRLSFERLDAGALLAEAEARWRPRLEREGFRFDVLAPPLPAVRGDREALLRALGNLLDNARKYAGTERRVELLGAASNGSVKLTVRDRGPGIPLPERARVLRPFVRLEAADRKETPGAGLGLSLAVSCMEAHGGRVEIEGGPLGGAAVSLVLPAEQP
jgi:signal transduction histidine kinase